VVPEGLRLVFLPPYTPELQPAERLWPLVDEPTANTCFETLADIDAVLADRCRQLSNDQSQVAQQAHFGGGQTQESPCYPTIIDSIACR
jgi:hypothetical protein